MCHPGQRRHGGRGGRRHKIGSPVRPAGEGQGPDRSGLGNHRSRGVSTCVSQPPLVALLLGTLIFSANGQAADPASVAILVQAGGEVAVKAPGQAKAQTVPALVKLHAGETLVLGKDAQARIVYFANGRQESWKGSGQVEIDEQAGKSKSLQATVDQVPPVVAGPVEADARRPASRAVRP